MNSRRTSDAFSLVELLVVLGIISIVSVIGVSMLDNRSSALRRAGGELADLSALARENALAQNAPTALLIVTNAAPAGMASLDSRAATLVQMDAQQNWNQIAKWTLLPASVQAANSSGFALAPLPTAHGSQRLNLNGRSFDVVPNSVAYLFDTDGRLVVANTEPAKVRVSPSAGTSPDYYEIIFNANTGTYKINRP